MRPSRRILWVAICFAKWRGRRESGGCGGYMAKVVGTCGARIFCRVVKVKMNSDGCINSDARPKRCAANYTYCILAFSSCEVSGRSHFCAPLLRHLSFIENLSAMKTEAKHDHDWRLNEGQLAGGRSILLQVYDM
jgi:hypothetical protein